jgi:hypothetical protein
MTIGNKNQAMYLQYISGRFVYFDKKDMNSNSTCFDLSCIDAQSTSPVFEVGSQVTMLHEDNSLSNQQWAINRDGTLSPYAAPNLFVGYVDLVLRDAGKLDV